MGSQILIESLPTINSGELSAIPENQTVGSFFMRNENSGDGIISAVYIYNGTEWTRITPLTWIGTVLTNENGLFTVNWGEGVFKVSPTVNLSVKSRENMENIAIVGFDALDEKTLSGKVLEKEIPLPDAEVFIQAILI